MTDIFDPALAKRLSDGANAINAEHLADAGSALLSELTRLRETRRLAVRCRELQRRKEALPKPEPLMALDIGEYERPQWITDLIDEYAAACRDLEQYLDTPQERAEAEKEKP